MLTGSLELVQTIMRIQRQRSIEMHLREDPQNPQAEFQTARESPNRDSRRHAVGHAVWHDSSLSNATGRQIDFPDRA